MLGVSKESSHRDGSFEYTQHIFWFRNTKILVYSHILIWNPGSLESILSVVFQMIRVPKDTAGLTINKKIIIFM